MKSTTLARKIINKVVPYFEEKQAAITTERCCIYLTSSYIQLVHVNKTETSIQLLQAKKFEFDDPKSLPLVLSGFVKKNNLDIVPTYWLLSPEDYQLFLIDSLPVPDEEIRAALNWRIRSLMTYPIEEAAIDYFKMPAKKSSPEQPLIAAVVAKKKSLEKTINLIKDSGLPLMIIDIPELALKNLSSLYENDEKCSAFLYINRTSLILNITREKTLYFTRQIKLPTASSETELYAAISLEILRYFDYFQSQWRHPNPTRIFVASDHKNVTEIATLLTENLLAQVNVFSLQSLLQDDAARQLLENNFLLVFGNALREGYQHVPTRD